MLGFLAGFCGFANSPDKGKREQKIMSIFRMI
jgi:hypothetical protein